MTTETINSTSSLTYAELTKRGIIEIHAQPAANAGTVKVFFVPQMKVTSDSVTQIASNLFVGNSTYDFNGIYALAMQGSTELASFKLHARMAYPEKIDANGYSEPMLLEPAEQHDKELFNRRRLTETNDIVYAFSTFLSYCNGTYEDWKLIELNTDIPLAHSGIFTVVTIDSCLLPTAGQRTFKRKFKTTDLQHISGYLREQGYSIELISKNNGMAVIGEPSPANQLMAILQQSLRLLAAIHARDPRLAACRLS